MTTEENKAIIRRSIEEVYNKGNLAVVEEGTADDCILHVAGGQELKGPEGAKQLATMLRTAFPDLHMTIEDMVAEGDKVAHRFTYTGTHKGDLMGIAPTGKKVTMSGISITRFEGGKAVEAFPHSNSLELYRQLGVSPPAG